MIKEVKDLLEAVVKARIPVATVVRSGAEEDRAIMARQWPLVSLITNPGKFDDRVARVLRYQDVQAGTWKQRQVRGKRIVPILLRCWSAGEDETDVIFSRILPAIPRRFTYDDFEGFIEINAEEHSDHTGALAKVYLSVAEVVFSVDVAPDATIIPTIGQVQTEPAT